MTNALIFDNLTYIPIRDAAAGAHLTTNYLARLARSGRLRARMVGRMWFLEMHSLQQFLGSRQVSACGRRSFSEKYPATG